EVRELSGRPAHRAEKPLPMSETIVAISRRFFQQVALPALERDCPEVTAQTAFGLFGLGSEAFGLDDAVSRDHHCGIRIDALLPEALFQSSRDAMLPAVSAALPTALEGMPLREGHVAGAGLAPDSLDAFLTRTLGLPRMPATHVEWLRVPEEDILHVINGEVWHDPSGRFT